MAIALPSYMYDFLATFGYEYRISLWPSVYVEVATISKNPAKCLKYYGDIIYEDLKELVERLTDGINYSGNYNNKYDLTIFGRLPRSVLFCRHEVPAICFIPQTTNAKAADFIFDNYYDIYCMLAEIYKTDEFQKLFGDNFIKRAFKDKVFGSLFAGMLLSYENYLITNKIKESEKALESPVTSIIYDVIGFDDVLSHSKVKDEYKDKDGIYIILNDVGNKVSKELHIMLYYREYIDTHLEKIVIEYKPKMMYKYNMDISKISKEMYVSNLLNIVYIYNIVNELKDYVVFKTPNYVHIKKPIDISYPLFYLLFILKTMYFFNIASAIDEIKDIRGFEKISVIPYTTENFRTLSPNDGYWDISSRLGKIIKYFNSIYSTGVTLSLSNIRKGIVEVIGRGGV